MERTALFWSGLYVLLAITVIAAETCGYRTLMLCTKPLLMPVLAIWLLRRTPGVRRFFRHSILAGLTFATLGDTLLMFSGGNYGALFFLLGLAAFLGTHIWYLGGFLSEVNWRNGFLRKQPVWTVPFFLFLLVFLYWLWPGIPPGMRLPVTVYALALSSMAMSVVNLRGVFRADMLAFMIAGALLFLFSDCLIAVQKFGHPFPGARAVILSTYLLGQWLIVRGVADRLRHVPVKK